MKRWPARDEPPVRQLEHQRYATDAALMCPLNEAITLYVGWGISMFPQEDAARVVERFGMALAPALVERVRALLDELRAIQPDWTRHTLVTASRSAALQMKKGHPDLDDLAVAAFEWIHSWWWR